MNRRQPERPSATTLLVGASIAGLAGGGVSWFLGWTGTADVVWAATTVLVLLPATWWVADALRRRQFGADAIAVLALIGTVLVGEYLAGAVIALMFSGGRVLEERAERRARRDLSTLLSLAPKLAHRQTSDGIETVDAGLIRPGDLLVVRPGEVVPVDGQLERGTALVDESMITGEPLPVELAPGDGVRSGAMNTGTPLSLRATATAAESTYAGLVRLAQAAAAETAPFVRMADRYAAIFLPLTLILAGGAWLASGDAVRAVAVLVVATPCPLILAAPIAFVSGMSRSARRGVVVKGGAALDALGRARVLLFDKTGTVTAGRPALDEIVTADDVRATEVLRLAAALDQVSPHVLAAPIVATARKRGLRLTLPEDVVEVPGAGVRGRVGGREVTVGKASLVDDEIPAWADSARRRAAARGMITVMVGVDGRLAGVLLLRDRIRPDSARTFRLLRRAGIERTVMVTGDRAGVAAAIAETVGADTVRAEQSPSGKVAVIEAERVNGPTVMVGDGVNDAAALAAADVGVALGARGASASSEAADVVITVDRIERLAETLAIARRTRTIARQSVVAGMGMSLVAMGAAAGGWLAPLAGAVVQEVIDVVVILNALRALGPGRDRPPRLHGDAAELVRRLDEDHRRLWPQVEALPQLADEIEVLQPPQLGDRLRELSGFLDDDLIPHERDDEQLLYPEVARAVGGADPTATMSRGHAEIFELARTVKALAAEVSAHPELPEARHELRRALYEMYAVVRLHFAQEEENFHSLTELTSPN